MGDNIYLGDRNGVRTPMQWSGDRNAGFSRANPQQLYLPVDHRPRVPLRDGQRRDPAARTRSSLLWWMRRLHRPAQALRGLRPRRARVPAPREPPGAGLTCASDDDELRPGRRQPVALRPVRRARPARASAARCRSSCSARPSSRPSASCPTCSRWAPTRFYWFALEGPREEALAPRDRRRGADARAPTAPSTPSLAGPRARPSSSGRSRASSPRDRWFAGKARVIRQASVTDALPLTGVRASISARRADRARRVHRGRGRDLLGRSRR